jgi:signal transduction histidine kinase
MQDCLRIIFVFLIWIMVNENTYILKDIASHQNELILVIDDQPDNLHYLKLLLREFRVESALSAKEGIRKAEELQPDLILLDIMMPEIDGFEACKMLKENEATSDIPIIFVTARVMLDDVIKGLELGANDYITKPFEPAELIARVKTHLDLQKAKIKLLEQFVHLTELNEAKNTFLQIAAHDLRNPLKVIQGFTRLIMERYDSLSDDNLQEFLHDISSAADSMLKIINDILTINDLEEDKYEIIRQEIDLTELILVLESEFRSKANEKNIRIVVDDRLNNQSIENDLLKTKQILENLIENALTYSFKGTTVTLIIEAAKEDEKQEGYFARIVIRDEGPGIPDEELPHIFDKFCKISNNPTGNEPSSGMGLAISKTLSRILNYNLLCSTNVGKGTDFILLLPKNMS